MPRELVKSQVGPYHVKVGWQQYGGVQLGVEVEGQRSIFWMLLGNDEIKARIGEAVKQLAMSDDIAGSSVLVGESILNTLDVVSRGGYLGLWSDLDRQGCNDLIRLLRRARDSSYGKDE